MNKTIRIVPVLAAFLAAIPQAGAAGPTFQYSEVCAYWQQCRPQAVNASGQVVGYYKGLLGDQRAFLWDNANPVPFRDLGPGEAKGINNSGQVVGWNGSGAFLWDSANGMRNIGSTFGAGVLMSIANAINNNGQVVGYFGTSQYGRPFLWDSVNGMRDLFALGGAYMSNYGASAVNDSGLVVGQFNGPDSSHAFLWNGALHDLGAGFAWGINNQVNTHGNIGPIAPMVGTSSGGLTLWKVACCVGGFSYLTPQILPDLEGGFTYIAGINNYGQSVGYSYLPGTAPILEGRPDHAVFWDSNGALTDVNPSGWTLSEATAINDSAKIVGWGWSPTSGAHAFLLTPVAGSLPNAPVMPSTINPGVFGFNNCTSGLWFDPPAAFGFEYAMTSGSLFTSILDFPTGFKTPFTVATPGCAIPGTYGPGASLDFVALCGHGVSGFTLTGIDPLVDPANPKGFPLKLAFNTATADFTMRALIAGDVNGDGKVDCADLSIVKASFGKTAGQSGFDARADVNHDGIVNIRDLAYVSQKLPAGTVCP